MRRSLAAAVAALLLCLAGCGGGHHKTSATPVAGHACNPGDYVMQCALEGQTPPKQHFAFAQSTFGIDFAWGVPSASSLKAAGVKFVWRYLNNDAGKDWNPQLVRYYQSNGIATGAVWETSASRAAQGCAAGRADALEAERQLAADGFPAGQPFDEAIDFDASGPDVAPYFSCSHQVAGDRENAYGSYRVIAYLAAHHYVGSLNFQTYAWSGGLWLPASIAPLEQYSNSHFIGGVSVDYDRAIAANYGQAPFTPPPPPGPTASDVKRWTGAQAASLRVFHRGNCKPAFSTPRCGIFAWRVVHYQVLLDQVQKRPRCFGPHAAVNAPVCQIIRPSVYLRGKARDASWRAYYRGNCAAVAPSSQHKASEHDCAVFRQRARFFDKLVQADFNAWR